MTAKIISAFRPSSHSVFIRGKGGSLVGQQETSYRVSQKSLILLCLSLSFSLSLSLSLRLSLSLSPFLTSLQFSCYGLFLSKGPLLCNICSHPSLNNAEKCKIGWDRLPLCYKKMSLHKKMRVHPREVISLSKPGLR